MLVLAVYCAAFSIWGYSNAAKKIDSESEKLVNFLFGVAIAAAFMYDGKNWYDDSYVLGYIIGQKHKLEFNKKRHKLFYFLTFYLIIESLRGISYFAERNLFNLTQIYWVFFFAAAGFMVNLKINFVNFSSAFILRINIKITIFLFAYLIYVLWSLQQFGTSSYIQFAQSPAHGTSYAIWANTAYLSATLITLSFLSFLMLDSSINTKTRYLSHLNCGLIFFAASLTLSRSAIIGSTVVLISFILTTIRLNTLSKIMLFGIILLFTLAGAFFSESTVGDFKTDLGRVHLQTDRVNQYASMISWFKSAEISRKLIGTGWRTSGIELRGDAEKSFSSSFIPILPVEIGILGVIIIIAIILARIKLVFQSTMKFYVQYGILMLLILSLGVIANLQTLYLLWFFIFQRFNLDSEPN